ncbi:Hypothetical predicted protein, partial [Octopus vulgaris]
SSGYHSMSSGNVVSGHFFSRLAMMWIDSTPQFRRKYSAAYSLTALSYDSFRAMSFSRDNMHQEFKRSSVMVD